MTQVQPDKLSWMLEMGAADLKNIWDLVIRWTNTRWAPALCQTYSER